MEESNPMLKTIVRYKHGSLLHLQTSCRSRTQKIILVLHLLWCMWIFLNCLISLGLTDVNVNNVNILFLFFQSNNCNFFRWRDREKIDPRSQFIFPKLVNRIKELEDEVWKRQIQINEQQVLIDNLTREKRFKRRNLKWCTFDWKVISCIFICVAVFSWTTYFKVGFIQVLK